MPTPNSAEVAMPHLEDDEDTAAILKIVIKSHETQMTTMAKSLDGMNAQIAGLREDIAKTFLRSVMLIAGFVFVVILVLVYALAATRGVDVGEVADATAKTAPLALPTRGDPPPVEPEAVEPLEPRPTTEP